MRIVVVGGKGMLGREICATYEGDHQIIPLDIEEIDVTKRKETVETITSFQPDLIINSAVIVDVDLCDRDPDLAWNVNAIGAQNIAVASAKCDSDLIYISTDYVFDGTASIDYLEYDQVNPINQYGKSKLYGEILSQQVCQRLYIIRSSWLFGHSPKGYISRILKQYQSGTVRMATDQLEAPTYTAHLARALQPLWESKCYGVYHISGGRGCTREEFACAVIDGAGLTATIDRIPDAEAIAGRNSRRPQRIVLSVDLYQRVCGQLPSWEEGIVEYFARDPYQGTVS